MLRLGSLFSGSGGFELAGSLCGIEPVFASEVEPYPIAVTRSRFPAMKHLGDISKVSGYEIEPVDIITFGSPCQDLSIAGKRAGLKHEANGDEETTRSGLFMEAVRIIKEMREATNGLYPRFALWENVPGAFSSNKGEDFRIVLEELIKIVEPEAVMPAVPAKGWAYADSYVGDGWSLAYRVFDAQYWGVPQRRRRIHLVLDLGGGCAREILFEREGLRGYFAEGGTPWKGTAAHAERSTGADDCEGEGNCLTPWDVQSRRIFTPGCKWPALYGGEGGGHGYVCYSAGFKAGQSMAGGIGWQEECAATLAAQCSGTEPTVCITECLPFDTTQVTSPQNGCNPKWGDPCHPLAAQGHPPTVICKCYDSRGNGDGETVSTLTGDHENRITDYTSVVVVKPPIYCLQGNTIDRDAKQNGSGISENSAHTLNAVDRHGVCYCMAHGQANSEILEDKCPCLNCNHEQPIVAGVDCRNMNEYQELYPTIQAKPNGGQSLNFSGAVRVQYIIRRLTPTECARLQGFADRWGDIDQKEDFTDEEYRFWQDVRNTHAAINGKQVKEYTKKQMLTWYNKLHTDSAEYKMWGNGIALPPALYFMQGMAEVMEAKTK